MKNLNKFRLAIIIIASAILILPSAHSYAADAPCDPEFYSYNNVLFYSMCETSCPAAGSGSLVGNNFKEKIWNFFITKGLTPEQTAGVMGNASAESGFSPFRFQDGGDGDVFRYDGNIPGYRKNAFGVFQWDGGRRISEDGNGGVLGTMMERYPEHRQYIDKEKYGNSAPAGEAVPQPASDQVLLHELDYAWKELEDRNQGGRSQLDGLKEQKTVVDAAFYFHKYFEISNDTIEQVAANRGKAGEAIFAELSTKTTISTGGSTTTDSCTAAPTGDVVMPVTVGSIKRTNPFGSSNEYYAFHKGEDYVTPDRKVLAMAAGEVVGINQTAGNNIVTIRHADGLMTGYWHMKMSDITVKEGDKVTPGQQIGLMGDEGQSEGTHLHFEIIISEVDDMEKYKEYRLNAPPSNAPNTRIDPEQYLKKNAKNYG